MRLTLDKVFGTCLEFHPSQFYNRMKHKAQRRGKKNTHIAHIFCGWRSCFYFLLLFLLMVMRSPETISAVIIACLCGLTTTATATTIFIRFHNGKCARLTSTTRTKSKWDLYFLEWITKKKHAKMFTHKFHFVGNFIVHSTHCME